MRRVLFSQIVILVLCLGCQKETGYRAYKTLDSGWDSQEKIVFELPEISTIDDPFDLFIYLRNDEAYPYANIFMIARLEKAGKLVLKDTLEYALAAPDGRWLGKGFLSVKESKLWWKEGFQFPEMGPYTISLSQAMRKNNSADGISKLDGIVAIGIELESIQAEK